MKAASKSLREGDEAGSGDFGTFAVSASGAVLGEVAMHGEAQS